MAGVEQELWNIFTYYTLHGDPLDPEHMRATQFVKFTRDCQIVGTTPVSEADVNVSYTAEVRRKNRVGIQRMTYNDFLTALMKLSIKVFPDAASVDDAFQQLLISHVLPLPSRRTPPDISAHIDNDEVRALFDHFQPALRDVFQFYATNSNIKSRTLAAQRHKSKAPIKATRRYNTMKNALGYPEFLKFASDFELSNSVILSTLEVGDIYLSAIRAAGGSNNIRKLSFKEFWEAVVRCALTAYDKISDADTLDKIRGLFLYMWRTINNNVAKAMTSRRNVSTYAGDLMRGAMQFNKRFTEMWAKDNYRDYLLPEEEEIGTGRDALQRIMAGGGGMALRGGKAGGDLSDASDGSVGTGGDTLGDGGDSLAGADGGVASAAAGAGAGGGAGAGAGVVALDPAPRRAPRVS